MRFRVSSLLVLACLFGLSAPVWASNLSMRTWFAHKTKVANVWLKPGQYRFVANTSTGQVQVESRGSGRVVARVKGDWVNLAKKSSYTEVVSTNHVVQEIRFGGKKKAVQFTS